MAKGIILTPQASCPIPSGESGLWVNITNELVHRKEDEDDINVGNLLTQGAPASGCVLNMSNNTGLAVARIVPVVSNTFGEIQLVDISNVSSEATVGVTDELIAHGASGRVITHGRLENIGSFSFGDVLYIDPTGAITATRPSLGGGYDAGDRVIKVGVVVKNQTNPLLKDLVVNINVIGIL